MVNFKKFFIVDDLVWGKCIHNPRKKEMFQEDVSEVVNKVSNIAGMIRARAPTHDAYVHSINNSVTKKEHICSTSMFFIHMFTLWIHVSLREGTRILL